MGACPSRTQCLSPDRVARHARSQHGGELLTRDATEVVWRDGPKEQEEDGSVQDAGQPPRATRTRRAAAGKGASTPAASAAKAVSAIWDSPGNVMLQSPRIRASSAASALLSQSAATRRPC